jgi:hypothetical protein
MAFSQYAHAAQVTSWKPYLVAVVVSALLVSIMLSLRNKKADSVKAKILLSGLYFWPLTFAGMMILALFYQLG